METPFIQAVIVLLVLVLIVLIGKAILYVIFGE